jgi:hypothetical protein
VPLYVLGYRIPGAVLLGVPAGLVAGLALWWWLRPRVAALRALAGGALLWAVTGIGTVTLSPSNSRAAQDGCRLTWDAPIIGAVTEDARLLNLLLFVPVGLLALVAFPRRLSWVAVVLVITMPALIEVLQMTPAVGRSCDAVDLIDNWSGGALGSLIGLLLRAVRALPRERPPSS